MKAELYFDGSENGYACFLCSDGEIVGQQFGPLSGQTCNEAEYTALIRGLRLALSLGVTHLQVYGDSRLVINQASGAWVVRAPHLQALRDEARGLIGGFERCRLKWIPRERNALADRYSHGLSQDTLHNNSRGH